MQLGPNKRQQYRKFQVTFRIHIYLENIFQLEKVDTHKQSAVNDFKLKPKSRKNTHRECRGRPTGKTSTVRPWRFGRNQAHQVKKIADTNI